ncbi:MAG TPA: GNAT family N-acetyltransferase [Leucothrix sp.]|nr:GNAT family N-acetyltransferase [Leucothrix sp.]
MNSINSQTIRQQGTKRSDKGFKIKTEAKTTNHVVVINTTQDFKNLKTDWNSLVDKSINPHPFILWEWMFTWWETYNRTNKDELCILAIYDKSELVAIAPFYIQTKGFFIKRLSLLGEGENNADAVVTAYPDIIAKESYKDQCVQMFSNYLNNNTSIKFNYASFNLLHKDSLLQQVGNKLSNNYIKKKNHSENQFVINLPQTEDDYLNSLSKSTKKQFRMKLNRIKKAGELEIISEEKLANGLLIVEKLHRARWSSKSEKNTFDSDKFLQFHTKLCERFQSQDIMNIRVMKHDGTPIAAAYNFNYKQVCYSYLSGFKSADDKRYSPMFIFDMLEIKALISKHQKKYDMLVSESENTYKSKFGSEVNSVYKILWLKKEFIPLSMMAYLAIRPLLAKYYKILFK